MKIYVSHSGNYDYESELYKPLKGSELFKEHDIFLPHEPENINVPAKEVLKQTDLLVAEVSFPSTGQGIELGLANAANVRIVCFYKDGAKPSSSLRFIADKIVKYADNQELVNGIRAALADLGPNDKGE